MKDRVVLITGVTDGLGQALAEHLVAEGARVVGCGRDADRIRATATRLGDRASIISAEVTIPAEFAKFVPLGRVGRASEFADLATYLLSPRSSYVTGSAVNIDGGACPVT